MSHIRCKPLISILFIIFPTINLIQIYIYIYLFTIITIPFFNLKNLRAASIVDCQISFGNLHWMLLGLCQPYGKGRGLVGSPHPSVTSPDIGYLDEVVLRETVTTERKEKGRCTERERGFSCRSSNIK